MTESDVQRTTAGDDFRLMAHDLRGMSAAFSEIATVWRRAHQCRPELPLGLPVHLEAATRRLARIADDLAGVAPGDRPALAFPVTEQMSALERDVAAAKAMTCRAGIPPIGDTGLWERLEGAMRQARARVDRATQGRPVVSLASTGPALLGPGPPSAHRIDTPLRARWRSCGGPAPGGCRGPKPDH
jgi:hypothetical protein